MNASTNSYLIRIAQLKEALKMVKDGILPVHWAVQNAAAQSIEFEIAYLLGETVRGLGPITSSVMREEG